jgi:hypothetical protein
MTCTRRSLRRLAGLPLAGFLAAAAPATPVPAQSRSVQSDAARSGPAQSPGIALVIGVDHYLRRPAATACTSAAAAVRDHLREQGFTVVALLDPQTVAMRGAINDFATQLDGAPSGTVLVYVCAAAVVQDSRVFVMPAGVELGVTEPQTQGIVLQALLNALAGTGGTLLADLALPSTPAVRAALADLGQRVPQGLHLALAPGGWAGLGRSLASDAVDVEDGWEPLSSTLASQPNLGPDQSVVYLPAPPPMPVPDLAAQAGPASGPASTAAAAAPAVPAAATEADGLARPQRVPDTPPGQAGAAPAGRGARPAPRGAASLAAARAALASRQRFAARGRAVRQASLERAPPARTENVRVVRLQEALHRLGFYQGAASGEVDAPTQAAISAFQVRLGHPSTGVMTAAEVVRLLNF